MKSLIIRFYDVSNLLSKSMSSLEVTFNIGSLGFGRTKFIRNIRFSCDAEELKNSQNVLNLMMIVMMIYSET